MSNKRAALPVQITNTLLEDHIIMLGEIYMKLWKIPSNETITVRYGSSRSQVKFIPVARMGGIRMSEAFANKLGLHEGSRLRLKYKSDTKTVTLGPLIGIMVCRARTKSVDRPFGTLTAYCKEVILACRKQGAFAYIFTPKDIGTDNTQMEGWNFSDGWYKSHFPIPGIVHNRLTSRILENKPQVQQFMKEIKSRYNTSIFNEKYLNKMEVFEALKKEPSLERYLPESVPLRNYSSLKTMCSRHPVVFLKPNLGSLGIGIIRITRRLGGSFVCHYASISEVRKQEFDNLPKLFTSIAGKVRFQGYQIQQGLHLIEIGNRPIDFRALVQKDKIGKWDVTSVVARIAGENQFVSNLARGGSISMVKEALPKSNLAIQQRPTIYARMCNAALEIAEGIEAQIPAHFGELGIDLAVDTNGRIWLLEVNSKPSKDDNTPLDAGDKIRPSVKIMIQYASHLSGF